MNLLPIHGRSRKLLLIAAAALGGCATSPLRVPSELVAVPAQASEADRAVAFARERLDHGDVRGALQAVETALAKANDHVDAHRVRQDLLRERGRRGLLAVEAAERLRTRAADPASHYLAGRLVRPALAQVPFFDAALALESRYYWGWLGLASALRNVDASRSLAIYRRLQSLAPEVLGNTINLASALVAAGRVDEAVEVYRRLGAGDGRDGVAELGVARVRARQFPRHEAWAPLLVALEQRPFDPAVRELLETLVREGLSTERLAQIRDVLFRDGAKLDAFLAAGGGPALAEVFRALGQVAAMREALGGNHPPREPRARRVWRRAVLEGGDVRLFLADLRSSFPDWLLRDEGNQVRSRWLTLLRGSWSEAEDPIATPDAACALVAALRDAGLLLEAEATGTVALVRHQGLAGADRLRQVRDDVRRLVAFEAAVRRELYSGYSAAEARDLDALLAELRLLSERILGRDVVGEPRVFTIPFVGRIVDPFGPGLPQHFARFNQHLVLGQRDGLPPEAMLFARLSLRDVEPIDALPLSVRAREMVGDAKSIEARTSLIGGDIAGVALVDNYVVDMDAARDWAASLARMRRIAREDGMVSVRDPLPPILDPLDPIDAEWRLACLAPEEDADLEAAVVDVIRWHERAHLSDTFHFLPPEWNLWRVIGLLWRNGLRATAVEADLEGRAELASLALSPHTRLVLAHIAGFCRQDLSGFSPHAAGFERLASALQARLVAAGATAEQVAVSRWHDLDVTLVRRVAAEMLATLW